MKQTLDVVQHRHDIKIIRLEALKERLGLGKSAIYDLCNDPDSGFPARVRLSARAVGWYEHEVSEWLANRPRA